MTEPIETDAEWGERQRQKRAAFRLWEAVLSAGRVRVTVVASEVVAVRESSLPGRVTLLLHHDTLTVDGTYEDWAAKLTAYRSA